MATKQRADKQKEKEKREKIILVALVAVLVIVGAIELPHMLKSSGGSSGATTSAAQTTPSSSTTSASATGTLSSGTSAPGSLPNASAYRPGAGQLSGFSLFKAVDPFGASTTSSSTSTSTTTSTTSGNTKSTKTPTTKTNTTNTPYGLYVAARISINGVSEDVALGKTFPAASPVFVLDSVSAKKIEVSIAGGSFSNGLSKLAIAKGKSVTLVNTVDSTRYTIKFITALTTSPTTGTSTTGTSTTGTSTTGTSTTGTSTTSTTGG